MPRRRKEGGSGKARNGLADSSGPRDPPDTPFRATIHAGEHEQVGLGHHALSETRQPVAYPFQVTPHAPEHILTIHGSGYKFVG